MPRAIIRAVLCLWAITLALAMLALIRGCAQDGAFVVRVDVPRIEFMER